MVHIINIDNSPIFFLIFHRLSSWNFKSTKWCKYDVWLPNYLNNTKYWSKKSCPFLHNEYNYNFLDIQHRDVAYPLALWEGVLPFPFPPSEQITCWLKNQSRDMFFALYDSWRRAQILRKNVSSDALRLLYTEKIQTAVIIKLLS